MRMKIGMRVSVCALCMGFNLCTYEAEHINAYSTDINTDRKQRGNLVYADYKELGRTVDV